jgi:signal transduction histidine kinase
MMVISDITSEIQEVEQKEKLDSLINYAISTTDIGIACYNIISGEGYATEFWFSNLGENANESGLIQPSYVNLKEGDKAAITDFKQRLIKGKAGSFTSDIQLQNQQNGRNKWIRESIFLRETSAAAGPVVVDINFNITADKVKEITEEKRVKEAHIAYQDSDRFINSISHEIRTPLTSIVGFSKMLLTEQNPKEIENITGIIKRNNNVLIELFNNILSIAKIDSGLYKFSKDEVKLNGLFRELKTATVHMLQNEKQLTAKNIEIIAEIPLEDSTIITDEWNFRQVMVNLLSNAVKFTKDGTITFGYQPQENGIYFYVKDTGCGISAKDQERIFNKFEKFDNYSMGTGLGLSLCKSIVRHLNGDLGVISNEGEGSTFWFVIKDLK